MSDANTHPDVLGSTAQGLIRSVIERVERVEVEEAEQREFKKEIYGEAKSAGLDVKALKKVVRERKKDRARRQEENSVFDLYAVAVGLE